MCLKINYCWKEIGMPQYAMLAYELSENMPDKIKFEEIPITKETTLRELKKYR